MQYCRFGSLFCLFSAAVNDNGTMGNYQFLRVMACNFSFMGLCANLITPRAFMQKLIVMNVWVQNKFCCVTLSLWLPASRYYVYGSIQCGLRYELRRYLIKSRKIRFIAWLHRLHYVTVRITLLFVALILSLWLHYTNSLSFA